VYYYQNRTSSVTLSPIVCGEYDGTASEGTFTVNSDGSFTVSGISGSDTQKNVTVTLTSGSETKEITLVIYGLDTARGRKAISEYCELI
jgi:hypothetical protein